MLRRWMIAVVLVAGVAYAQGAIGSTQDHPLVVAFGSGSPTLDPIMRSLGVAYSWQRHIFDTVTWVGRDGTVQPRIATTWSSDSNNTWTLAIRQGVKFQNGDPLTAQDVAASIMDALKNPKSQVAHFITSVSNAVATNDHTVQITTSTPDPLLPMGLTQIPVMPEAYMQKVGRDAFDQHPIGTGPYSFVGWLAQDHLDLKAWSGYWGKQPAYTYVKLEVIPDAATRVASLLSGQIQVAENVAPQDFSRIKSSGKAYISAEPGFRTIYLAMDDYRKADSPGFASGMDNPFLKPLVRKAVAEAIDLKAIRTKLFDGAAEPATQFMPPSAETYDSSVEGFSYNPNDAKSLLAQAGYPNGFSVKLDATTHHYLQDDLVAQAIAGMLGQVGIKVDLNVLPSSAFFTKVDKGEESFYMAGWGTTNPFATYDALYHCVDASHGFGKNNAEHYCNTAADKLMLDASAQFDATKRVPIERQAMADTRKDVAYIPLYYQDVIAGVSDTVSWTSRFDEKIYAFEMAPK